MKTIFIIGNGRSGTTMLGRILNKNQEVHTFNEIHFFEQFWSKSECDIKLSVQKGIELCSLLLNIISDGYFAKKHIADFNKKAALLINNKELTGLDIYEMVLANETVQSGKKISCKQTPQYVFYIEEILTRFPDSKFIFLVRDPRAVLISQKNKWRRKFLGGKHATWYETIRAWFNYHPYTISKLWKAAFYAGMKFKNDPRLIIIKFEDLIQFPESTVERICKFSQIEYSAEMLNVPQIGSSTGLDNMEKTGIKKDRVYAWKNGGLNDTEIFICEKICGDNMSRMGYDLLGLKKNFVIDLLYKLIFPFKLTGAFLLNLHRMKNIIDTIKKRLKAG